MKYSLTRNLLSKPLWAGVFTACLGLISLQTAWAQTAVAAPSVAAKSYLLLDLSTNQELASLQAAQRVEPASLTKLMTAYLVFSAIKQKQLTLNQTVNVSPKAWKAEGSRMFIEPNRPVTVDELLHGTIIQSGNDSSIALAEAVAGDETSFAALMNREAKRMGLKNTNFKNATGLPDPEHYSTAEDLGKLASNLIKDYPEFYKLYSEKEYSYNGIKQPNRNRLLWVDPSVDGMKTGHTEAAGFCLVSSANRTMPNGTQRRLLSVILGTPSDSARAQESLKLLNYGYQMFETARLYNKGQTVITPAVYKGKADMVKAGFDHDLLISVPRGTSGKLQANIERQETLTAPIRKGAVVGHLKVNLEGKLVMDAPILALEDVEQAGLLGRLYDSARLWMKR